MVSSKSKKLVLLISLVCLLPSTMVWSADLVLRERATVRGPVICLGDVADISASSSTQLKDLITTTLFPAPAPGTQQFLSRSQIRDLLVSRGIDIQNLRVLGAKVVEIGSRPDGAEETMPATSLAETKANIAVAIQRYLIDRTGHEQWRVSAELHEKNHLQVASWGSDIVAESTREPRSGRQSFQIKVRGAKESVRVLAIIVKVHSLLYARRAIVRGSLVRATDVEVREYEGVAPSLAVRDLQQVVGMEAKRTISPNSILTENHVSAPLLVKRGETVMVFARTGGISVRTMAVAKQDGAMGDLVQVQSVNGKKRYSASVSGSRRLDVYPTGARVEDFATLSHRNKRQ